MIRNALVDDQAMVRSGLARILSPEDGFEVVAGGAAWFDPSVAPRILEHYRLRVAPAGRQAARLELLTERERDVLRLIARGATNGEIAATLYVAEATVKTHVASIPGTLGVRDLAAAIVFAYSATRTGGHRAHCDACTSGSA